VGPAYPQPYWCRMLPLLLAQMGMVTSAPCECGAEEQAVDYVVL